MEPWWFLSRNDGVEFEERPDGSLVFQSALARITISGTDPAIVDACRRVASSGDLISTSLESVGARAGIAVAKQWREWLRRLLRRGILRVSLTDDTVPLISIVPISHWFEFPPSLDLAGRRTVLSRFALIRRMGDLNVLESPLSHARLILHDERVAAYLLRLDRNGASAARAESSLSEESRLHLERLLVGLKMLTIVTEEGSTEEENDRTLMTWDLHGLYFHTRSRRGRTDGIDGATYRFVNKIPPSPALRPAYTNGPAIPLGKPDLDQLFENDRSFTEVLEHRTSIREYGARPITARQLGEFLFRVARVRMQETVDVDTPSGPFPIDFALRVYPGGGGLYELEFYCVVKSCEGIPNGLYHYDPLLHELHQVLEDTDVVTGLAADAANSVGLAVEKIQVLIVLASRFPRLAWKYECMAYSLTLKNVGVAYQTMYLVATAMGLAPCGSGVGNSDLFAMAVGSDYYSETSVGEFLLGSLPDPS